MKLVGTSPRMKIARGLTESWPKRNAGPSTNTRSTSTRAVGDSGAVVVGG